MFRSSFARLTVIAFVLLPVTAAAEPVKLKFSYFSSDRSAIYTTTIKPFVDAVNAQAKGLVEIEMYFSGAIGKVLTQEPQLVADGVADMAMIIPGYSPERFPDNAVIELPGIFRDGAEAALVYTRLVAAGALNGYEDFFVIGALASEPQTIHGRKPIASIADLRGQTIRANNRMEATVLKKFGAIPAVLAINQTTEAISRGNIDGATLPPAMLFEFGVGRVASNHYLLQMTCAPIAIVMNRKKFESLPAEAQAIIREHSGEWLAKENNKAMDAINRQVVDRLLADPKRKVVVPSQSDLEIGQRTFDIIIEEWAASNPRNHALLGLVKAELAKLRSAN